MLPLITTNPVNLRINIRLLRKGSRYLRKTLYQIILPVIIHNEVFYAYYNKKLLKAKAIDVLKAIVLIHVRYNYTTIILQIQSPLSFQPQTLL